MAFFLVNLAPSVHEFSVSANSASEADEQFMSSTDIAVQPVSTFRMGEAQYELREQLNARWYPRIDGRIEYTVDGFGNDFVGLGDTPGRAQNDWRDQVHSTFQRLLRTRPFEMSQDDERRWNTLQNRIDIAEYRRTAPIRLKQIGRVRYYGTSIPRGISWISGGSTVLPLRTAPAIFASLPPNQWVEAVVLRDPIDNSVIEVPDIQPIQTIRRMSDEQKKDFLRSLPTGSPLGDNRPTPDGN